MKIIIEKGTAMLKKIDLRDIPLIKICCLSAGALFGMAFSGTPKKVFRVIFTVLLIITVVPLLIKWGRVFWNQFNDDYYEV